MNDYVLNNPTKYYSEGETNHTFMEGLFENKRI